MKPYANKLNIRPVFYGLRGLIIPALIAMASMISPAYGDPDVQCDSSELESVSAIDCETSVYDPDLSGFVVCLDPGHPSEVSDGMTVQNGITENNINWLIAIELAEMLESDGITVMLTKSSEDQFVTNRERAEIANDAGADLFFRIHCDSGPPETRGIAFYYPDRQGTFDDDTGPPEEILPACHDAAYSIHDIVAEELDDLLEDRGVRTDNDTYIGSRQGGALRGSILSTVPVVLLETCFLSNPDDAEIISNPETRALVVSALAEGIKNYLVTLYI